jgi:hypothetical protein
MTDLRPLRDPPKSPEFFGYLRFFPDVEEILTVEETLSDGGLFSVLKDERLTADKEETDGDAASAVDIAERSKLPPSRLLSPPMGLRFVKAASSTTDDRFESDFPLPLLFLRFVLAIRAARMSADAVFDLFELDIPLDGIRAWVELLIRWSVFWLPGGVAGAIAGAATRLAAETAAFGRLLAFAPCLK